MPEAAGVAGAGRQPQLVRAGRTAAPSCCAGWPLARRNGSPMFSPTPLMTAPRCWHTRLSRTTPPRTGCSCATWRRAQLSTVLSGPGNYRGFTFDRKQQQFVFVSDRDDFGKPDAQPKVYYGTLKDTLRSGRGDWCDCCRRACIFAEIGECLVHTCGQCVAAEHRAAAEDTIPADSLVGQGDVRSLELEGPAAAAAAAAGRFPRAKPDLPGTV